MKSLEVQYFSCSPHSTFLRSFLFSFAYPKRRTSLSRKSKNISPQNQKFIIQSYLPKNESLKMKSDPSLSSLEVWIWMTSHWYRLGFHLGWYRIHQKYGSLYDWEKLWSRFYPRKCCCRKFCCENTEIGGNLKILTVSLSVTLSVNRYIRGKIQCLLWWVIW